MLPVSLKMREEEPELAAAWSLSCSVSLCHLYFNDLYKDENTFLFFFFCFSKKGLLRELFQLFIHF